MTTSNIKRGLPASEYHADNTTVSKHGLDLINQAPALFRWEKTKTEEVKQSDAMRWGTLVHLAVLEPHLLKEQTIFEPEGTERRSSAGKAAWRAFEEEQKAAGRTIVTKDELAELSMISLVVHNHPAASALLSGEVSIEDSVYWTDEQTGVACRCRPDLIRCDGLIVDLKTTQDAGFSSFSRDAAKFRYHVQAAMYLDGLRANGVSAEGFVFIAVEKTAPYLVQCFAADDAMIDAGRIAYRRDLETYAQCLTTGEWPGYSELITSLSLPAWATRN